MNIIVAVEWLADGRRVTRPDFAAVLDLDEWGTVVDATGCPVRFNAGDLLATDWEVVQ